MTEPAMQFSALDSWKEILSVDSMPEWAEREVSSLPSVHQVPLRDRSAWAKAFLAGRAPGGDDLTWLFKNKKTVADYARVYRRYAVECHFALGLSAAAAVDLEERPYSPVEAVRKLPFRDFMASVSGGHMVSYRRIAERLEQEGPAEKKEPTLGGMVRALPTMAERLTGIVQAVAKAPAEALDAEERAMAMGILAGMDETLQAEREGLLRQAELEAFEIRTAAEEEARRTRDRVAAAMREVESAREEKRRLLAEARAAASEAQALHRQKGHILREVVTLAALLPDAERELLLRDPVFSGLRQYGLAGDVRENLRNLLGRDAAVARAAALAAVVASLDSVIGGMTGPEEISGELWADAGPMGVLWRALPLRGIAASVADLVDRWTGKVMQKSGGAAADGQFAEDVAGEGYLPAGKKSEEADDPVTAEAKRVADEAGRGEDVQGELQAMVFAGADDEKPVNPGMMIDNGNGHYSKLRVSPRRHSVWHGEK